MSFILPNYKRVFEKNDEEINDEALRVISHISYLLPRADFEDSILPLIDKI